MSLCEKVEKTTASHRNIVDNARLISENYDIMQLYSPTISYMNKQSIDYQIENFEYEFVKLNITKMLFEDGQGSINFNELYALFRRFMSTSKQENLIKNNA